MAKLVINDILFQQYCKNNGVVSPTLKSEGLLSCQVLNNSLILSC